jgi:hypothetical protein
MPLDNTLTSIFLLLHLAVYITSANPGKGSDSKLRQIVKINLIPKKRVCLTALNV